MILSRKKFWNFCYGQVNKICFVVGIFVSIVIKNDWCNIKNEKVKMLWS
jgi:hypothetical protein